MKKFNYFTSLMMAALASLALFVVGCDNDGDEVDVAIYHTVTFDSQGGTTIDSQSIQENYKAVVPEDPTLEGYEFGGWYTDAACTEGNEFDLSSSGIESDITLYAKWSLPSYYTVSFDYNYEGSKDPSLVEVPIGECVDEPKTPTREDHEFVAWYVDAACTVEYDFSTAILGDITVYADWIEAITYLITFDSGDGTAIASQIVVEGGLAEVPEADPTLTYYIFKGWYTADGDLFDFSTEIYEFVNLYAKWEEAVTYYVTFESNEGSEVETQRLVEYDVVVEPEDPTRKDYEFIAWCTDEALTMEYDFSLPVTSDMTLYAEWKVLRTYYVTFESNGGSEVEMQEIIEGELATQPENPTYEETSFAGWYADEELTMEFDFSEGIYDNTTIYAKWTTFTVTFVMNGGDEIESLDIRENITFETPESNYDGNTLVGWYSDEAFTTLYDFESLVTENVTLYARWWSNDITSVEIGTEAELIAFRTIVNATTGSTIEATLTSDITLTEESWSPIGSDLAGGITVWYSGVFDGADHTIYGLKITGTTAYQGLFGVLDNATIKNVTISEPDITTSAANCGSLVGRAMWVSGNVVTIENCKVIGGSVYSTNSTVGGLIGVSQATIHITNCHNIGTSVYKGSGNNIGGVIGYVSGTSSLITNCSNSGELTTATGTQNGGISGYASNTTFTGCHNSGSLTAPTNANGGIIGTTAGTALYVIGCYNTGVITGASNVGGIIGQNGAATTVVSCYSYVTNVGTGNTGSVIGNKNSGTTPVDCYGFAMTIIGNGYNGTEVTTIAELNAAVPTMNANETFAATDYMYQAGETDDDLPTIVARE